MPRRKGVFALLLGVSLSTVAVAAPPPPGLLAISHDTRWGTSTDADGWIFQALGGANRLTYLDTVNGNDANTGLSHAQAKKTLNVARAQFIGAGCKAGDKLLIAQGSVGFDTSSSSLDPIAIDPLGSPSNLSAIQSYDPADPTNAAKWGRAVGAAMPVIEINPTTGSGLNVVNTDGAGYIFYQGIEVRSTTNVLAAVSAGISWQVNKHPGMVIQNCRFNGTAVGQSSGLGTVTSGTNTQNGGLVSKCSFWGSAGLFVEESDTFKVEEVFGAHGGWDISAVRDDPIIYGGPSVFTHMFYLHASNTNMQLHRVIAVDATDGLGARCGATAARQLISIDNPVGITAGGKSSDAVAERPDGAPWACDDVVIAGMNQEIQPGNPGGWGLEFLNTRIGAYTRNVAAFDFDSYGFDASYNRYFAGTRSDPAQVPTYMLCDQWSGYRFAVTGETDSGVDLTNYHLSITNSVLDVIPTGLNGAVTAVTTRSVAPAGYKSRSDLYSALGYANKAAWVNAMCFRPDLVGQMSQAICGIALPAMGLSPLYQTASPPTVVVGAPVIYKTAATDLTISTLNFTRGTPSMALLSGVTACATLSSADLPAGFSMTAFRLTASGTCTSGSNQITGLSTVAGVLKGMLIEAKSSAFTDVSLFPLGTVVTNIVGSTITCSNNATGNSAGETIFISAGGRVISYDGSGSGAATPTVHMLETPKDAGMATHTTAFVFNIAAAGAWTPLSLGSGLAAWYDADQQTEVANAAVATFVDRSGNGRDFTQASGAAQPLLRFASINGKKTLEFDGALSNMQMTSLLSSATAGAWFAVIKLNADPPAAGGPVLAGFSSSSLDEYHPFSDGNIYDGFGVTARNTAGNPTPSLASTALIGAIAGPGDYRFLVNNTTLFSTAGSTIGFGSGTRNLGKSVASGSFLAGLVAEVIVTNYVPTAGDIANIVSYVNTKFGTSF